LGDKKKRYRVHTKRVWELGYLNVRIGDFWPIGRRMDRMVKSRE